ncbi:M1 family metallopeptidase [uncultured Sphingomonas sp.]|uniref:M1 family metallopeptidase n=1 Tax=uncultured Sphingomonas sp. TaxID=158754 RepID=UPI0035CA8A08
MAALALAGSSGAATLPGKGEPPITAQTQKSGGPVDPAQAALRFDLADLSFEVLPATRQLRGRAVLAFTTKAPIDRLLIDLDRNLGPRSVAVDGIALPAGAFTNPQGKLIVTLPRHYAAGETLRATIVFGGTPHVAVRAPWDDGVVWSTTKDGRLWFATTSEGFGCDILWPCLDFPTGEPARVALHITVPAGLKAPSNGVLRSVDTLADGRTTWNWEVKHPNTYGIALNVGPYEELRGSYRSRYGNTIPMFYWYLPGEEQQARGLFAEFAPTLDFFEANVGPYPFGDEKVGVVETPHLGMEHQTINAYGNGYAKAPEGFDWLFQHEFSHEWFGNQVTAANWDDYWLHEGYGQYMQPAYGLWREGYARYATMMQAQRLTIVAKVPLIRDRPLTEEEVYEPEKGGPGGDIYSKGAWMLHTLRFLIGEKAFWDVTRLEVYGRPDPRPGNFAPRYGSTREYQGFVTRVTGRNLDWFFDVYLRRAALPDLIEKRQGDTLTLTWAAPDNLPFPMPVEVLVGDQMRRVEMPGNTATITVPADTHVVLDPFARILRRSQAIEDARAWRALPQ